MNKIKNYGFIDSQNLHLAIKGMGWKLDFHKFRIFLAERFDVQKAYLFIGFVEENQTLYKQLQEQGYILIFRPTLKYKDGTTKGNCDAELVLHAMIEKENFDKAVIVSSDGDFYCLAEHFRNCEKLEAFLIPNKEKYSALLKRINTEKEKYLHFLNESRNLLEYTYKKRAL